MNIFPLILLTQAYNQQVLNFEGVRGIYQPDFSSCSARDQDTYKGIFQAGPLTVMKTDFSVTIFNGSWMKKNGKLFMRTERFMERDLHRKPTDWSHDTFLGGFVFEPTSTGDLRLIPGSGMVQKSNLTFRRIKSMTVVEALKLSSEFLRTSDSNAQFSLGYSAFSQLIDQRDQLAPVLLDILKSTEPLAIRTEAASRLGYVKSERVVKEVGDMLLQQDQSTDSDKRIFRRILARTLEETRLPSSFDYAVKAYEAKLISLSTAITIAGASGNPKGIGFLKSAIEGAKDSTLISILVQLRKLSGTEALAFCQIQKDSPDADMQFEILRTIAEAEPSPALRDKAVQSLIDLFPKSDWMNQCDIAKSLGTAQTKLAYKGLLKITTKGSHEAVQQWIDQALAKYKT